MHKNNNQIDKNNLLNNSNLNQKNSVPKILTNNEQSQNNSQEGKITQTPTSQQQISSNNNNNNQQNEPEDHEIDIKNLDLNDVLNKNFLQRDQQSNKLTNTKLYGYNLAIDMVQKSRKFRSQNIFLTAFIISAIRSTIPWIDRKVNDKPVFGEPGYERAMIICLFLSSLLFYFLNYAILSVAYLDLKGKIFMMHQLSYLVSPKFPEPKFPKYYPTINIFDPISLKMWKNLRKVVLDYGKRFIVRNTINLTIYFLLYLSFTILLTLEGLGIVSIINNNFIFVIMGFETLVIGALFTLLMLQGAELNDHSRIHKTILKKNKTVIADMVTLKDEYFGDENIKPSNMIYKKGVCVLEGMLGKDENFNEKLDAHGEKLEKVYTDMIEELEFDEINHPYKIAGIPITYTLLKGVAAFMLSIIAAVLQNKIN